MRMVGGTGWAAVALLWLIAAEGQAQRRPTVDLRARAGAVTAICFSPDGKRLAAGYADEKVRIWDLDEERVVAELAMRPAVLDGSQTSVVRPRVEALAWSPDGTFLAVGVAEGSAGGTLRLWDAQTWQAKRTLASDVGNLRCIAISPDSTRVAVNAPDRSRLGNLIRIYDVADGRQNAELTAEGLAVSLLAFMPDGKQLVSAGGVRVTMWDLEAKKAVRTLSDHRGGIGGLAVSGDGKRLASGDLRDKIRVVTVEDGKLEREIEAKSEGVLGLCFTPSGRTLISFGADRSIRFWSMVTGKQRESLHGNTERITGWALRADGGMVASASRDGRILMWPVTEPEDEEDEEEGE